MLRSRLISSFWRTIFGIVGGERQCVEGLPSYTHLWLRKQTACDYTKHQHTLKILKNVIYDESER
jgi:hypothetical protein